MFTDFKIIKKCKTTNARVSTYELNKNKLNLPIFMPVATYGAMRGVKNEYLSEEIILSNTYHLRNLNKNIKNFMRWEKSMLTDSGGFQIQSLPNVEVNDNGVIFDGKLFLPEDSMNTQMILGADIIMQLDDVVNPLDTRERHEIAIKRSIEWLDRAINHINMTAKEEKILKKSKTEIPIIQIVNEQIIFPIVQGGLFEDLRSSSINEILKRKPKGLAIGGLCGGENKNDFCKIVYHCCKNLPDDIPRYVMGVGYPDDIVICSALGTDMSDCVYPTRTARFGRAFCDKGDINVDNRFIEDLKPLEEDCGCKTCKVYSRAYLATIKGTSNYCMLMSIHNLHYMRNLTRRIRESIQEDKFPQFIKEYFNKRYPENMPEWIISALKLVNVDL